MIKHLELFMHCRCIFSRTAPACVLNMAGSDQTQRAGALGRLVHEIKAVGEHIDAPASAP